MPVVKSFTELPGDKRISKIACYSEGKLILNLVLKQSSGFAITTLRTDRMSVMPVCEGAAKLRIGEVRVPDKGIDLCLPLQTNR